MANERFFDPEIPGLNALLLQVLEPATMAHSTETGTSRLGFRFYPESGLKIVLYGPPGAGKTVLALQMAVTAAIKGYNVIYFTKDTPARVLNETMTVSFNCFREKPVHAQQGAQEWHLRHGVGSANLNELTELSVIFLNQLLQNILCHKGVKSADALLTETFRKHSINRFLAFADFNETPAALSSVQRYTVDSSVYQALGHLQPELKPIFNFLEQAATRFSVDDVYPKQLIRCTAAN